MKVLTILGTRPEIIRLARVMAALDRHTEHTIAHTGQNYDYELNEIFFKDLGVREPDIFMNVDTSSVATVYAEVLIKTEKILSELKPDCLLILGDTNSAIAAIIAKRMHIPIFHMEAGNRSFDWRVPEEVNRHIVDSISDINLVYTEHARRNLLNEGLPPNTVYLTGSPMAEVLFHYKEKINNSNVLSELEVSEDNYFVVSLHREENVDSEEKLKKLVSALNDLAAQYDVPVLISLHPRTQKNLIKFGLNEQFHSLVKPQKPLGFFDYNKLQKHSLCTISDSGTLSEEASMLGFNAVTPRQSMERPEGLDSGSLILSGIEPTAILEAVKYVTDTNHTPDKTPFEYNILDCSNRVLSIMLSRPLSIRAK